MQEIEIKEKLKNLAERAEKGFSDYIGSYIGDKDGKKIDKNAVKGILRGIVSGFAAFLFGGAELGSGIRPFGAALICATEKNLGYMFVGLVLSSLARWQGAAVDVSAGERGYPPRGKQAQENFPLLEFREFQSAQRQAWVRG